MVRTFLNLFGRDGLAAMLMTLVLAVILFL